MPLPSWSLMAQLAHVCVAHLSHSARQSLQAGRRQEAQSPDKGERATTHEEQEGEDEDEGDTRAGGGGGGFCVKDERRPPVRLQCKTETRELI